MCPILSLHLRHSQPITSGSNIGEAQDYQEGVDREGNRDWEMLYTPGPKAIAEYNGFTNRQVRQHLSAGSEARQRSPLPQQAALDLVPGDNDSVSELIRRGITLPKAMDLVAHLKPEQSLADQLEYLDYVIANAPSGKFHNATGFYVTFIQDNTPIPETFATKRTRQFRDLEIQEQDSRRSYDATMQHSYEEYVAEQIGNVIAQLPLGEYDNLVEEQRRHVRKMYPALPSPTIEEIARGYVRRRLQQSTDTRLLSFDEFRRDYRPKKT
jgi:hypothetical protein